MKVKTRILISICLLWVGIAWGGELTLEWTAPTGDRTPSSDDPCGLLTDSLGQAPLTGLKDAIIVGKRFKDTDSLVLGIVPTTPGERMQVRVEIENGSMGELWVLNRDPNGNVSCKGSSVVFAIPASEVSSGLNGNYYQGLNFDQLSATRVDPNIDFDWGYEAPFSFMRPDSFSIQWEGRLHIPTSGTWTIYASTEDGVRLWIDGVLRLDNWRPQGETEVSWTGTLNQGLHPFRMDYFARNGHAAAHVRYQGPGITKQAIPAIRFFQ